MRQREHQDRQGHSSPDSDSVITSFDELAKGLATGAVSRRKALRWMGSALVGAALASLPGVTWANDRCSDGQTRCGDRCVNLQRNERHCGSCFNRCRSTQTCCKGRCVNLLRNERHCGSCFNRCPEGEECVGGVCQGGNCPEGSVLCTQDGFEDCYSIDEYICGYGGTFDASNCQCICPPGTVQCSDGFSCSDLQTDSENCGQCGNVCTGPCVNGVCA